MACEAHVQTDSTELSSDADDLSQLRVSDADDLSKLRVSDADDLSQLRVSDADDLSQLRVSDADDLSKLMTMEYIKPGTVAILLVLVHTYPRCM